MTEEHKDTLISKMLESPAALSDIEIMQILEDEELRDIYSLSVDIKAAKENQTEIEPTAEWNRFRLKLVKPRRWNVGLLSRVAAILVGALLVSAGLFFMTNKETSKQEPKYAQNEEQGRGTVQGLGASSSQQHDSINLQEEISVHDGDTDPQVTPKQPRSIRKPMLAKSSRPQNVKNQQTVDVEEYVRIQQARMENDFAVQQAEAIVNQYYAMADINDVVPSGLGDGYQMDDEILTLIIP